MSQSCEMTSERWTCTTLGDGLDQVASQSLDAQEAELLQQLEELNRLEHATNEEMEASDLEKFIQECDTVPATESDLEAAGKAMGIKAVPAKTEPSPHAGDAESTTSPSQDVSTSGDGSGTPLQVVATPSPTDSKAPTSDVDQEDKSTSYRPKGFTLRQWRLRRAAKARISRMLQPKSKRKELTPPDYVRKEWENGDKNALADLLQQYNFQKDTFFSELLIIVKRKKSFQLVIDEGWYSEEELKELGWSTNKINGAKTRCLSMADTHTRRNSYDQELEFWVTIRESGKRMEESSYEHEHSKRQKADSDPVSTLGTDFKGLDAATKRDEEVKTQKVDTTSVSKYMQTKEALKKVLASMISKSGKLRSLQRELKKTYTESATTECLKDLEMQIKKVDGQYDLCNEVWAQGEVEGFQGDQWYNTTEKRMKDATFVCAKAAAIENKIRNAKKFYDKKDKSVVPAVVPKPKKEKKNKDKKVKK